MKFLLLCKRYYTNKDLIIDRFGRLFHLPNELIKNGHEGIVIAANYRQKRVEIHTINGLSFYSIPFSITYPFSFLYETYRLFNHYKPHFIIASGDSHFGAFGLALAKRGKIPFIFDVYDHYAAFGTNKVPGMKFLYRLALRKADLVTCASVPLENYAKQFNQATLVIENGVDLSVFKPLDKAQVRKDLTILPEEIIIGYFGSMDTENCGVHVLIEACQQLRLIYPTLRLLLAGKLSINVELNKSWIRYEGVVTQQTVTLLINACQVVVIPYLPSQQVNVSNACKIAEYLACQVPVVTTRVANYADFFTKVPQAICSAGDVEEMMRAISMQLESPQLVSFPEELTWEQLGKKLSLALLNVKS
jgi:glycosyltransferase involved in cell wall biosynthesis